MGSSLQGAEALLSVRCLALGFTAKCQDQNPDLTGSAHCPEVGWACLASPTSFLLRGAYGTDEHSPQIDPWGEGVDPGNPSVLIATVLHVECTV